MKDRHVRCEALSQLFGRCIKPHTECPAHKTGNILSVNDFHHRCMLAHHFCDVKEEFFVNLEEFFDQRFDFDFTNMPTSSQSTRGNERYERPVGWYRMAVKVLDKYPDGNTWLGQAGWRSESSPGEWPASYHGTSIDGAKGIIQDHYIPGSGQVYGRGIYSTPLMRIAGDQYAKMFISQKNGKRYKVVMQNRINPNQRMVVVPDYWLVPVPQGTSKEEEKFIVERSIRPYGILIKEV
ncbi:hypothetical protein DPEC_G00230250 [Dallia pectoralis]|uniref:Uncharacterized protein n=1 Tax=Dallia pectoralis TaxID=75939 RepID=A0ACC2G1T8_DALPE|nr:hypothetical protein DPEC_G00230250 [Dallia pectoralis]